MAVNKSTRAKLPGSGKASSSKSRPARASKPPPDLDAILGRFNEALAMLECVKHAFVAVEEGASGDERMGIAAIGAEICTLERAVKEIKAVYNEFDLVLVAMANAAR